jgi:hypothetical protein
MDSVLEILTYIPQVEEIFERGYLFFVVAVLSVRSERLHHKLHM